MAIKIAVTPVADPKGDNILPEDDMAGYAEGNEPDNEIDMDGMKESPEEEATEPSDEEEPSLSDIVPEASPDSSARIAALEAQLASVMEKLKSMPPPPEESPEKPEEDTAWAEFETDYPDIAGPIKKLLDARGKTRDTQISALHTRVFEEAMDAARPNWRDLRNDPKFGEWMQAHPEQQKAAQVPGVRAAVAVIKAYEDSKKGSDLSKQRADRLKGAVATPTKGGRAPALSDALEGWAATD